MRARASTIARAPRAARRSVSWPVGLARARSRCADSSSTGPVSSPSSMRMMQTPVSRSPARMRALDGRRAAPARQQRRVDVEATARRDAKHRCGKQQAVGRDDHHVGAACANRSRVRRGIFQRGGLLDGDGPCARRAGLPRSARQCSPRPAGRSGWVRTRGTSWPAARIASRARAAKGGVPAKTTRKDARPESGGLALAFLQLRADAVLLQFRQVIDEDLALQVIHLVLDAGREHRPRRSA